jgi:hypothetical protein
MCRQLGFSAQITYAVGMRVIHCAFLNAAVLAWAVATPAQAERNTLGPHLGVNFDYDDPFIGVEGRIDLTRLNPNLILQLNPSFSFYFLDGPADLFNISVNVPFEFRANETIRPFFAPGIGIWHWDWDGDDGDTELMLNLIAGVLFIVPPVEPFVQLRVAVGDSSFAELMGGVLFRL